MTSMVLLPGWRMTARLTPRVPSASIFATIDERHLLVVFDAIDHTRDLRPDVTGRAIFVSHDQRLVIRRPA